MGRADALNPLDVEKTGRWRRPVIGDWGNAQLCCELAALGGRFHGLNKRMQVLQHLLWLGLVLFDDFHHR